MRIMFQNLSFFYFNVGVEVILTGKNQGALHNSFEQLLTITLTQVGIISVFLKHD